MLKALSVVTYIIIFLPIWAVRRLTGKSRFGRSFHNGPSAWDLNIRWADDARPSTSKVNPAPLTRKPKVNANDLT